MIRRYHFALLPFITVFSTATYAETIQEAIKNTLYTHPEVSASIIIVVFLPSMICAQQKGDIFPPLR